MQPVVTAVSLGESHLMVKPNRASIRLIEGLGVDVDDEVLGGDGTVPLLFFFRDIDKNQLMVVEAPG